MLTWRQKLQRYIKRHKKKATLHTTIATLVLLVVLPILNWLDTGNSVTVKKDENARLTITMVGDMMFARNYKDVIAPNKGYEYAFQYVLPYLKNSDYVTGNFESPIVYREGYPKADKFIHLAAEPEAATALKKVGFHSVNLANNHMKDYGKQGLLDTLKAFDRAKVDTVGAGRDIDSAKRISYKTINGIRIAVLGFSDVMPRDFRATKSKSGIAPADPDVFFKEVAKAKNNANLVLVHMHWGLEYDSGYHPRQRDLGRALIDAGADIVIGHHPHVLEPVEVYKNGIIFYSLGNFVFDQGWSRTKESVLVQYKLMNNGQARIEIHPIWIRQGQPRPVTGWMGWYRREKIFSQVTKEMMYTDEWNKVWKRENNAIVRVVNHSAVLKRDDKS